MQRVCVIGCGGSGKSTLSNELEKKLNLPLYHLDTLFYKENWVEIEQKEFDEKLSTILKKDAWIIDGNFKRTMDMRLKRSDTAIFLDYPRWQSLYGALSRLIKDYGKVRKDMSAGCPESFNWEFLKYIYNFNKKDRPQILKKLKSVEQHCQIIIFKSRKQTQQWLETLCHA